MKTIAVLIVLTFISLCCMAQSTDDMITSSDQLERIDNTPYIKLGAGYWMPTGNLSPFLKGSPLFDLSVVIPDELYNRSFEIGVQYAIPQQGNYFLLRNTGADYEIEATSIVNGYLRLNKYIWSKDRNRLELSFGLGISSIFLDPVTNEAAAVLDYDNINSFLVNPGISYTFQFKDYSSVQLSYHVQYTPFKMERGATKNLSSFTMLPQISYRF